MYAIDLQWIYLYISKANEKQKEILAFPYAGDFRRFYVVLQLQEL
jgi:hypothetical protein